MPARIQIQPARHPLVCRLLLLLRLCLLLCAGCVCASQRRPQVHVHAGGQLHAIRQHPRQAGHKACQRLLPCPTILVRARCREKGWGARSEKPSGESSQRKAPID
jgi:hypothetical protein